MNDRTKERSRKAGNPSLKPRQKVTQESAKNRRAWDQTVFAQQERLFNDGQWAVDPKVLKEVCRYLTPELYDEVILERESNRICGYSLCDRPIKVRIAFIAT